MTETGFEIIVVDNASTDGSRDMIRRQFPEAILLENKNNLGFAKGNNLGIKKARGRYILLLNSDTVVKAGFLGHLLKELEAAAKTGAAGPRLLNRDGSLQPSAGFYPSPLKIFYWMFFIDDFPFIWQFLKPYHVTDAGFYRQRQEAGWLTAACLLVKKEALKTAGTFDESIFMYGEEVDLCRRIIKKGYRIVYQPESEVCHYKGASAAGSLSGIVEEFKSLLYLYKRSAPKFLPVVRVILRSGALLRLIVFGIIMRQKAKYKLYAQAYRLVG